MQTFSSNDSSDESGNEYRNDFGDGYEHNSGRRFEDEPPLAPVSERLDALTPVASLWHTILLLVIILGGSFLGSGQHLRLTSGKPNPHIVHPTSNLARYASTFAMEWIIFAYTVWGLKLRKVPLRRLTSRDASSARRFSFSEDIGIALLWWIAAVLVLALLSVGAEFLNAHSQTAAHVVSRVAPNLDAHKASRVVTRIAPHTPIEIAAWIILSISAGICEETIFRGYLQHQFSAYSRNVWIGVILTSLVFGAAHGYEGIGAMLLIAAFGAMFSALAIWRRSLRTGIIAHAWHDAFTGIIAGALHLR